jgi:hypothetical protein
MDKVRNVTIIKKEPMFIKIMAISSKVGKNSRKLFSNLVISTNSQIRITRKRIM